MLTTLSVVQVGVNKEKEPMFRWTMKARKHLTANPSDKQTFQTICRMYRYIRQVKKGTDPSSITENYTTLRTAAKEEKILNTAGKRSINGKTIDQYDRARALALEVLKTP